LEARSGYGLRTKMRVSLKEELADVIRINEKEMIEVTNLELFKGGSLSYGRGR
jgi:hypothetical protein